VRRLDLADLVAIAAELTEIETPKLLEILTTTPLAGLLAEAGPPLPPHEAAAVVLTGIVRLDPLPAGTRRLALLTALRLLAVNGLDVTLDPPATRRLMSDVAAGAKDVADVAAWLDPRVTAADPLAGALRDLLTQDAWGSIMLAGERARRHRRRSIVPEDLLLGLFREGAGPAAQALGAPVEATGVALRPSIPPASAPDVRKVLELAMRAAVRLGHGEISGGHLLLGLLEGGHTAALPGDVDPGHVRRRVLELLGPPTAGGGEVAQRLDRLAGWLRATDPEAAAELEDVADLHRAGLDRLVEMMRAWRGEVFVDALAKDDLVARLLGSRIVADPQLARYLADIEQYPPTSTDEEAALAEAVRTGQDDVAAQLRRRLIQGNLRLVVDVAAEFESSGLPKIDLIQEGNLGLLRAAEHFGPTTGIDFPTFARPWVREAIERALRP
jgi:sigma-70-like protein/ClpA/ClpB-like protein